MTIQACSNFHSLYTLFQNVQKFCLEVFNREHIADNDVALYHPNSMKSLPTLPFKAFRIVFVFLKRCFSFEETIENFSSFLLLQAGKNNEETDTKSVTNFCQY